MRVCLCGEDLDWLGYRCIAAAIDQRVSVTLTETAGAEFFDERILDHVWSLVGGDPDSPRPRVRVAQDAPLAAGLGSSSAVALCAARLYHAHLHGSALSDERAVEVAYEAERRVTRGGGMDQVAIACRGIVRLQGTRERRPPAVVGHITDAAQVAGLGMAVFDSRSRKDSGKHLARIRERDLARDPRQSRYCEIVDQLTEGAWTAIRSRDWPELGTIMNQAHAAMRDLQDMSTPAIEAIRDIALSAGFDGVKITGSGSGGCLVGVVSRVSLGEAVRRAGELASTRRIRLDCLPVRVDMGA